MEEIEERLFTETTPTIGSSYWRHLAVDPAGVVPGVLGESSTPSRLMSIATGVSPSVNETLVDMIRDSIVEHTHSYPFSSPSFTHSATDAAHTHSISNPRNEFFRSVPPTSTFTREVTGQGTLTSSLSQANFSIDDRVLDALLERLRDRITVSTDISVIGTDLVAKTDLTLELSDGRTLQVDSMESTIDLYELEV